MALMNGTQLHRHWPRVIQLLTLLIVSMLANRAHATVLKVEGGPGGGGFVAECRGQFLVGISIRSGSWVDAIAPLCAPFMPNEGRFGKKVRGARHGGQGGSALLKDGSCPSDRFLSGIRFGFTMRDKRAQYLDFVELTCTPIGRGPSTTVCLQTGDGCYAGTRTSSFPGGFEIYVPGRQDCPSTEAATGIHGRSGAYVDALGLICGPKPTIVAKQPPERPSDKIGDAARPILLPKLPKDKVMAKTLIGIWDTQTSDQVKYTLTLASQGGKATGFVGAADPRLDGTMQVSLSKDGKEMSFVLNQPKAGLVSRGQVSLSASGDSFSGRITKDSEGVPKTWTGTRRK